MKSINFPSKYVDTIKDIFVPYYKLLIIENVHGLSHVPKIFDTIQCNDYRNLKFDIKTRKIRSYSIVN